MMAYASAESLVAVANAPRTVDATLEEAYHSAGIYFPFTDFPVADPYKEAREALRSSVIRTFDSIWSAEHERSSEAIAFDQGGNAP